MAKKINIAEIEAARDQVFAEIDEKLATLSPTSRKAKALRKKRLKLAKKVQKIKVKAAKRKNIADPEDEAKKQAAKKAAAEFARKDKKKKGGISYEKRQGFVGFMFVLPWFMGFLFFFLQPLLMSLNFSFSNIDMFNNYATTWAGMDNYLSALQNATFIQNLTTTLSDLLVNVPVIIVFSLFVAVLLNRKFIGRGLARAIFFLPVIVTTGVVMKAFNAEGDASSVMEGEAAKGLLFEVTDASEILTKTGLPEGILDYLTQISDKIFDIIWQSGIQILLFLAALQGISPQLYEASDVEGATAWETFWLITFPSVAPIIIVNVVYTIIDSFSSNDNVLLTQIQSAIDKFDFSTASAMSWMYFIVIFIIIGVIYLLLQKLLVKDN